MKYLCQLFWELCCLLHQSDQNLFILNCVVAFQCVLRERRWSDVLAEISSRPTLGKTLVSNGQYIKNRDKIPLTCKMGMFKCMFYKSSLYLERTFAPISSLISNNSKKVKFKSSKDNISESKFGLDVACNIFIGSSGTKCMLFLWEHPFRYKSVE